ncbi:ABC transporter family substrate-binding protein [Nocardia veterana]|uniref:ABC transporter family substrate-binding protein n=1 Tax=Nocardia veterana TaxID=132249 RepID=A0A7X6RHI6_9NOCA|nr:ABC transporter family substrate-binding protein [Nocardia veterana]NKY85564.1 ABC transporter family substrate-binding protein [Nocardia veterana]
MRIRSTVARLAIPAVAIGLIVSGCSSDTSVTASNVDIGGTNDINPKDLGELREGGNLRLALTDFPATFNYLHVDGGNESTSTVIQPTMPDTFVSDAKGDLTVDHNYFTDIKLTNTNPQQVTYTINPKAVWSDGSPITWEDLRSQAQAQAGADRGYQVAAVTGFDRVAKVERGVDDRQAVVTFSKPYAEWQGQFSPLYPKAVTESPGAFNDFARNSLPLSAGPFMVGPIDRTQNRITLVRNPKWWGPAPKLDTITLSVLDHSAWLAAVQNNELDYAYMSGLELVSAAKNTPGIVVRRTPEPSFSHITFNGAPGALLSDPQLRLAISKAIDRQAIVTASQHGIVADPKPLNNHIYMMGQKGYQDNSAPSAFDPNQAAAELDALGWKLNGDVREKDGRKLVLRDVMYQQDQWVDTAKIVQQDLAKVGVKLDIQTVPGTGLFTNVIDPGNFDLAQFSWGGSVLPLSALPQIYAYDPNNLQGNKARIGSPELNAKIEETISELDPAKAIELANECDKMIWQEGYSLPLNQASGTYAVRDNLANIGAFGLASPDWTKVGFLK